MQRSPDLKRVRKLPSLTAIYDIPDPAKRLWAFNDFLWCKSFEMRLPLTPAEKKFDDTHHLFGAIPADGWPSVFDQTLNYPSILGVIELLRFCDCSETAAAIAEALELFYNGRTDLLSVMQREEAGIRGFRHPTERRRFIALGDIVEQLPLSDRYFQILRWTEAHREEFVDFPRP